MLQHLLSIPMVREALTWALISIVVGYFGKKIKEKYKDILYFLLTAIEIYDEKIGDIIPKDDEGKYKKIKKIVARLISPKMKKTIDKMLDELGYLDKTHKGNGGYIYKNGKYTIGKDK